MFTISHSFCEAGTWVGAALPMDSGSGILSYIQDGAGLTVL